MADRSFRTNHARVLRCLDSADRMTALAGQATTSQEYTALTQENLGGGKER